MALIKNFRAARESIVWISKFIRTSPKVQLHQRHLEKLVSDWGATDLLLKLTNLFELGDLSGLIRKDGARF